MSHLLDDSILESQSPRLRSDISWIRYSDQGRWVALDSISSAFYYFSQFEHDVVCLMDGTRNIREIIETINVRWLGKPITVAWLQLFLARLGHCNLLHPSLKLIGARSPGNTWRSSWLLQTVLNPLAIRVPVLRTGRHPIWAKLLAHLLWNPIAVATCFILLLTSMTLVIGKVLQEPSYAFQDLERIQGDRWMILIGIYVLIKSLHEMGHYLACVKWGVACKEIGILLLFFAPSLYCDTTDSWKLTSKWHRAAIAAAGMYIELWIAGIAGIVYLNTQVGLWHTVSAQAIMVCTLSTLVVNGNPFFRYDGYYILSDLWGVPNLAKQCNTAMWQSAVYWLGGRSPDPYSFDRPLYQLVAFGIVSALYRLMVMFLIVALVWNVLIPNGLGGLAMLILSTMAFGLLLVSVRFSQSIMTEFFVSKPIRLLRFAMLVLAMVGILWVAFFVPVPLTIRSRGFIDCDGRIPIYCQETARLKSVGEINRRVPQGTLLFEFENPDKRKELMDLEHELAIIGVKIQILQQAMVSESSAAFELPTLLELQKELEAKRWLLRRVLDSLKQTAATEGIFFPTSIPVAPPKASGRKNAQPGHAIQESNLGLVVERGTQVGWFASDSKMVAHAIVSEQDARSIRPGMEAYFVTDSKTDNRIPGRVKAISPAPLADFPSELLGDSGLIGIRDERGKLVLETPHYLAIIEPTREFRDGVRGGAVDVEFRLANRTLTNIIVDFLSTKFQRGR
ncbi:MAG: site-2 protease family protein [Pirellula sp.]